MAAHKKNPFVEVLAYIRTAPEDELKHVAAAAAVELKARQPQGEARQPQGEAPKPRKARKAEAQPIESKI